MVFSFVFLLALVASALLLWKYVLIACLHLVFGLLAHARPVRVKVITASPFWPRAILISSIGLRRSLLGAVDTFADLNQLNVKNIQIIFPTLKAPQFQLVLDGVFLELKQRDCPKPCKGQKDNVIADPVKPQPETNHDLALNAIENILWGKDGSQKAKSEDAEKGAGTAPSFVHKTLFVYVEPLLKRVVLKISDISVLYVQDKQALQISLKEVYYRGTDAVRYTLPDHVQSATCIVGVTSLSIGIIQPEECERPSLTGDFTKGIRVVAPRDYLLRQWSMSVVCSLKEEGGCVGISMEVDMKSIIVTLNEQSVIQLLQVLSILQNYLRHAKVWRHRPSQPVVGNASAWWHYAASAVLDECQLYKTPSVGIHQLGERRAKRANYLSIYKMKHSKWWKGAAMDTRIDSLLKEFERDLTLEEIAHFRAHLAWSSGSKKNRIIEKLGLIDAIVNDAALAIHTTPTAVKSGVKVSLSLNCPVVSLSLRNVHHTSVTEVSQLHAAYNGESFEFTCFECSVRSSSIETPLLLSQHHPGSYEFIRFHSGNEVTGKPKNKLSVSLVELTLDAEWTKAILDLATLMQTGLSHFSGTSLNVVSLVQSTYAVLPSKPTRMAERTPISISMDGLSCKIPAALPGQYVAARVSDVRIESGHQEHRQSTFLRASILHRKRRDNFQSIVPSITDKLRLQASVKLVTKDDIHSEEATVVSIPCIALEMLSEQSPLPKCLNSTVSSVTVSLPILEVCISGSRLGTLSGCVGTITSKVTTRESAPKAQSNADMPATDIISMVGRSDKASNYCVHLDAVLINLLDEQVVGSGSDSAATILKFGVSSLRAHYLDDAHHDIKLCKYGLGALVAQSDKPTFRDCILCPTCESAKRHTVSRLQKYKKGRPHWAMLREKLCSLYIFDFFPPWVTHQIYGTVCMSGGDTVLRTHLTTMNLLIDADLFSPLLKYINHLQTSLQVVSTSEGGGKASGAVATEEPARAEVSVDKAVSKKSATMIEIDFSTLRLTLSQSHTHVADVEVVNGKISLCTLTEEGHSDQRTDIHVERIIVHDMIKANKGIISVLPSSSVSYGVSVVRHVDGVTDTVTVDVANLKATFIQRFIRDVLFCVSGITGAAPKEEKVESGDDAVQNAPASEQASTTLQRMVYVSVRNVEVTAPIRSKELGKHFRIAMAVKVRLGSGNTLVSKIANVSCKPFLEVNMGNVTWGYVDASLGSFHPLIGKTDILCYLESVESSHTRVLIFCEVLSLNLSQLLFGNLMDFLYGNFAETTVFVPQMKQTIEIKPKEDFVGKIYEYSETLEFPAEERPSFELCITSCMWHVSFQENSSQCIQYALLTLQSPSFTLRTMQSHNMHIGLRSSSFTLEDRYTCHSLTEVLRCKPVASLMDRSAGSNPALNFMFVICQNGTMAMDLETYSMVVSWPYLADLSFLTKILSVFAFNEPEEEKLCPVVSPAIKKWFYFNFIGKKLKIFVPLAFDEGTEEDKSGGILAQLDMLRFRYAFGGDGQAVMTCNLYDGRLSFKAANSFTQKPFILPFNFELKLEQERPLFEELAGKAIRYKTVTKIQRQWRSREGSSQRPGRRHFTPMMQLNPRKAFIIEHGLNPNEREPSVMVLKMSVDQIVLKASFSEVCFWRSLLRATSSGSNAQKDHDERSETESNVDPLRVPVFRPSLMEVDLKMDRVSLVVCDDRPLTYGNPDVLRLYADLCSLMYKKDCQDEDGGAKTSADLVVKLSAQFLDNSVSRYSTILCPWTLNLEFNQEGDAYGGQNNSLWANSEERLDIQISPHLLLALGDVRTFTKLLTAESQPVRYAERLTDGMHLTYNISPTESDIAPQKYCLNNYSGLPLWYWSPPKKTAYRVADGQRAILKVQPELTEKRISSKVSKGGTGQSSVIQFECLSMQFEGNWCPLDQINVSLVGKYKYFLRAPLHKKEIPVIVDIVLVGRTKVISIHSPYWIFNRTDRDLFYRLQLNLGYLNAPSNTTMEVKHETESMTTPVKKKTARSSDSATESDLLSVSNIGPIGPDTGFYLPITASINNDALLFMRCDELQEASSHSINIVPVDGIEDQQQMIECKSVTLPTVAVEDVQSPLSSDIIYEEAENEEETGADSSPLSSLSDVSLNSIQEAEDKLAKLPDPEDDRVGLSGFYCNLHINNVLPQQVHLPSYVINSEGFAPSQKPIECELSFQPPLVLHNALPYEVELSLLDNVLVRGAPGQLERVSSVGSVVAVDTCRTFRRASEVPDGILLRPGEKADIYCDLRTRQRLSVLIKTGCQGILRSQLPLLIHDGQMTNKDKQNLPKGVKMVSLSQEDSNAYARRQGRGSSEIEMTPLSTSPVVGNEEEELNRSEISPDLSMMKQKLWLGVENVPTGPIGREITLYCPYWIDNQTGCDLLFSENDLLPYFGRARGKDEILVPAKKEMLGESQGEVDSLPLPILFSSRRSRLYFRLAGTQKTPYSPSISIKRAGPSGHNPIPLSESFSKQDPSKIYHFSVDMVTMPTDSIYNKTKVISVKTAIIIENVSSFSIAYRQCGVEDRHHKISSGQSIDHCWDSASRPMEITVHPCGDMWNWSSTFPLLGTGDTYFGLRLSHQDQDDVFLIIPVSITVSATHILVSFKDPSAEPPYRIQNDCKDVCVKFEQVELQQPTMGVMHLTDSAPKEKERELSAAPLNPQTTVLPGTSVGYAWDVPTWPHRLTVHLDLVDASTTVEYAIDDLGDRDPLILSEIKRNASGILNLHGRSHSILKKDSDTANHLEKKLKAVLAKELALRVFVSVYADGPTRVLRFSDKKDTAAIQEELSMLEMHARLRKLEDELANNVNRQFASLYGTMKNRPLTLDLYGRNTLYLAAAQQARSAMTPKPKKTPGRRRIEAREQTKAKRRKLGEGSQQIAQSIFADEMKDSVEDTSNTILSLGGELTVTVHSANNIAGNPQTTHSYAEIELDGQIQKTHIALQTCDPVWNENFVIPNTHATSFLNVSIVSVRAQSCAPIRSRGGTSKTFLGSVRIPLLDTFTMESSESIPYVLGRRQGSQQVSGEVILSIAWKTSATNLMQMKVRTYEDILAQRMEILAGMQPTSADEWEKRISDIKKKEALVRHLGYQKGDVTISVIAAKNLKRRSTFQPLATLDFSLEGPLCNPFVMVSCSECKKDMVFHTNVVSQSLDPVFDKDRTFQFEDVPLSDYIKFDLYDKTPFGSPELIGSRRVYCSEICGSTSTPFNPVYAWINLEVAGKAKKNEHIPQLHVRMQWYPPHRAMKNTTSIYLTLNSIGVALISGGVGGELINMTFDQLSLRRVLDDRETVVSAGIKRVQIDNQLPNATQPVVLQSVSAAGGIGQCDFLSLNFTEIFSAKKGRTNIRSIRDFQLRFGDLKLEVDDLFLDAILTFVQALPIGDLWQDAAWDARQRCMLDFHLPFGPPEISDLCGVAVEDKSFLEGSSNPCEWYSKKVLEQIQGMRALSSSSSWYFIEKATIGSLRITLSLSITSKLQAFGSDGEQKSLLNRSLSTSGLQLIDVDDAPLQIKGLVFSEEVIGVNALKQRLQQHLQWQFISEAHKVLGGSGPAIAGAPLSVLYAFSSAYTIGQEITAGRLGPLVAAQSLGYVAFSAVSQAIGALSKTLILVLALSPTDEDHGDWADAKTLKRYSAKPLNAPNSMYSGFRELFTGTVRGLSGFLTDPVWAYQHGGIVDLPWGIVKGVLGIPIRPVAGFLECSSRISQGIGLLCLGREGIEGILPHRVRAPIIFQEQVQLKSIAEAEYEAALQKWKETLSKLSWQYRKVEVLHYLDLDQIHSKKKNTLLFTRTNIILVCSSEARGRLKYFIRWNLECTAIKQMFGREEKFKIKLKYIVSFSTACCGVWTFPNTKIIQCATQDIFRKANSLITLHRDQDNREEAPSNFAVERRNNLELIPRSYFLS